MTLLSGQGRLDLDDLRLLAAVSEAGSLAGAARRLAVNHASAWRRLGGLERRLGVRLFERSRAGYAPTSAGEDAALVAERLLAELDALERRLGGQDVRANGVVRLTLPETLLGLVAPILLTLRGSHPAVVVEVVAANAFFTLTRRDADIALRPADQVPDGLVARRLATVASALYAAPGYIAVRDTSDVRSLDWLSPDDSLSHLGSARWIASHVAGERIVHRASSLTALAAAARAGLGIAPLPCLLGDPDPVLVRLTAPMPEMATSLWLITHPDLQRTARIRVVLDTLAKHFLQLKAVVEGGSR